MNAANVFENPLVSRYSGGAMVELWSAQRKFSTWRQLWLALAEAQFELKMPADDRVTPRIRAEQLDELRKHIDDIDFQRAAFHENRLRHDVMAHIHTLAEVAPVSRDIIHLGATSCFVTDNTDLILMREAMTLVRDQLVNLIDLLGRFAQRYRDVPTLGYTHFQPAQLTTVGKRACMWCFDFVLDLREIERRIALLPFRGAKGATGTQASFLELFRGDHEKVRQLDRLVTAKMGFEITLPITGQTYSRKIDSQVLDCLSGIGQSACKWGNDLRLLAHEQELIEPSEPDQVGSSAMAYKKNPMLSERMCSISRFICGLPNVASQTASTQWLERSLDDSAARRLYLPQAFLSIDAILRLGQKLAAGLRVNEALIARHVSGVLPFMATESILMQVVASGGDRQMAHERIRRASNEVTSDLQSGIKDNELIKKLRGDSMFSLVDFDSVSDPKKFVGRAPQQVDEFISEVVEPIRRCYPHRIASSEEFNV